MSQIVVSKTANSLWDKDLDLVMTEWNWDDALDVRFEEGCENGIEIGRERGREEILKLLDQGLSIEEVRQHFTKKSGQRSAPLREY